MDTATLLQYSTDNQFHYHYQYQSHSPFHGNHNRTFGNAKRTTQTGLLRSSTLPILEKASAAANGGVFLSPHTIPPFSSSSYPRPLYPIQPQQPPLLPLPIAFSSTTKSLHQSLPGQSPPLPPTARVTQLMNKGTANKKKDSKTTKRCPTNTKAANKNSSPTTTTIDTKEKGSSGARSAAKRVPETQPPKKVLQVGDDDSDEEVIMIGCPNDDDSVFAVSPPPSSLPLPKFSLRPKLSCNLEAADAAAATAATGSIIVDAGATDNLCRFLNLR